MTLFLKEVAITTIKNMRGLHLNGQLLFSPLVCRKSAYIDAEVLFCFLPLSNTNNKRKM